MSLFKWSTPERRKADQLLPIIPNEIYIYIFEHITPSKAGCLSSQELITFGNLSRVCRFFANFCLPRIFEFVEFSGSIFRNDRVDLFRDESNYRASRETALCTQIAARQPLALSLAERVRSCHITNWQPDDTGSWAVRLFMTKYLAGVSYMKNLRKLAFSASLVDAEHWSTIGKLESLEELSFDRCQFEQGPADNEPEETARIKVSCLRVTDCVGHGPPTALIDHRFLRTLAMDHMFFEQTDWLRKTVLTKLCFCMPYSPFQQWSPKGFHTILMQAPQSVETVLLSVHFVTTEIGKQVRSLFDDSAWKNLPRLRSFTLQISYLGLSLDPVVDVLCSALPCLAPFTILQSFTLTISGPPGTMEPFRAPDIQLILQEKINPISSLKYVVILGEHFCSVDGTWSKVV